MLVACRFIQQCEKADCNYLSEGIAWGPMPVEEVLPILKQMVDALGYAHEFKEGGVSRLTFAPVSGATDAPRRPMV